MASVSGLLKSAASIRNQLATYQDSLMAYEYSNSAHTDTAYAQYSAYLNSRIGSLNTTASISNASKSLSLTKALESAQKANMSGNVQRENIQVLSGNATLTDKYNLISKQFVQAQAIGDMTLAQTLEGQAYSLSQTIQSQAQTAADAQKTLATANATTDTNIATNLDSALKQLNATLKVTGQKDFNSVISNWVSSNKAQFNAMGVNIPPGSQPNYWDVVNGVVAARYNYTVLASQAVSLTDPAQSQKYMNDAVALTNGTTKVDTLGGSLSIQDVQSAMQDPSRMVYDGSTGGFKAASPSGYTTGTLGQPVLTYSGSVKQTILSPDATAQMTKLGLSFTDSTKTASGTEVQISSTGPNPSPLWLQQALGKNGVTNIYEVPNSATGGNMLQLKGDSISGKGQAVYTIAKDGSAWESSNLGDRLLSAAPQTQQQPTSFFGKIGDAFMSGMKNVSTMLMGQAYADSLPSSMLSQATSHYSLPPIPVAKPMQLPTLSIAQPTTQAALPIAKAAPVINPAAPSPQVAAQGTTVQSGGSGISLQGGGGGMSLQGGGGAGISLQ